MKKQILINTKSSRSFVLCGAALLLASGALSQAAVVEADQFSSGTTFAGTTWAGLLSNSDLINNGQSTLSSFSATNTDSFNPGSSFSGVNNGSSSNVAPTTNAWVTGFPSIVTYNLNTSVNTLGYDITSIQSIMGWDANSSTHGNQNYTVSYSVVGSLAFTVLHTVAYSPFTGANSTNHESYVNLTDSTGVLATGVDVIRFQFTSGLNVGSFPGSIVREVDVFGTPTVIPEPSAMLLSIFSLLPFFGRRR